MRGLGLQAGCDLEFSPAIDPSAQVHYAALVENSCIGPRTKVWQFASVIRGSKVGADCSIATGAIVDGSRLGDRCIVSHGAFIDPGMQIGNDVFVGPHVCLCNDYWPRVSKDGWFDMQALISGKIVVTRIEDGASLGAGAIVMPGIVIGSGAMVAAGAVVTANVPADALYRRDGLVSLHRDISPPERKRAVSGL